MQQDTDLTFENRLHLAKSSLVTPLKFYSNSRWKARIYLGETTASQKGLGT